MLVFLDSQMAVLQGAAQRQFEAEMLSHLRRFSPKTFAMAGEPGVRTTIQTGIQRAHGYGLSFRGPVRLYLELMMMLGSAFDTDPQYPWASQVLQDRDFASQM